MRFVTWITEEKKKHGRGETFFSIGAVRKPGKARCRAIVVIGETEDGYVMEINDTIAKRLGVQIKHRK